MVAPPVEPSAMTDDEPIPGGAPEGPADAPPATVSVSKLDARSVTGDPRFGRDTGTFPCVTATPVITGVEYPQPVLGP